MKKKKFGCSSPLKSAVWPWASLLTSWSLRSFIWKAGVILHLFIPLTSVVVLLCASTELDSGDTAMTRRSPALWTSSCSPCQPHRLNQVNQTVPERWPGAGEAQMPCLVIVYCTLHQASYRILSFSFAPRSGHYIYSKFPAEDTEKQRVSAGQVRRLIHQQQGVRKSHRAPRPC